MRGLVVIGLVAALAGCGGGGGGSKKLSNDDISKLTGTLSTVTGYCVQQIQAQSGVGTGGDLGQLNAAVSDFIDIYKKHTDAKFALGAAVGTPRKTMKSFARTLESQLGTGGCAPDQARRIESAVTG